MRITIIHKLSISAVVLVLISVGVVGGLFYSKTNELLVKHAVDDISGAIRDTGSQLKTHIDHQRRDTLIVASTPPIQGMLRALKNNNYDQLGKSSYQQWVQRVQTILLAILKSKPTYLQICFIDKNGQELVNVRHVGEKYIIHTDAQLKKIADNRYVKQTLKLAPGAIYLSDINLHRKNGHVSIPHREVLRSATPVYDQQTSELAGLVIVNAEIGHELRKIQNKIHSESHTIYITNDHGGYLLHPDSTRTYGFDLGKRYRIQEDFPSLANFFLPTNKENRIVLVPQSTNQKHVLSFVKIPFDIGHPERFIAVGITELYSAIVLKQSGVQSEVLILALMLVVIVMLIAILFSYRLARPISNIAQVMDDYTHHRESRVSMPLNDKSEIGMLARRYQSLIEEVEEAQAHLKQLNRDLEILVEERTADLNVSRIEAERANAAKSDFLSRMSHELRTPMNAILGFAQILEMDTDDLTELQRSNVNEILEAGHHLLNLINDVLDLAKIESGKFELSVEKVLVDDALQQCLRLIAHQAEEHRIEIVDNLSGSGYIVRADFTRLKQILLNLLSNAVKYNNENGRITLQGEITDMQRLRISVSDTGDGLSVHELSRLFTPFDRLQKFGNVEGTGIGLVITKHLVELMKGSIGVESVPGKGSTFWIELALVTNVLE